MALDHADPIHDHPQPVLCLEEAAQLLGISTWLLLKRVKQDGVPHRRVGRRILFSRQRLLEWVDGA